MSALLSADALTAWRGETCVLDAVSLTIQAGEVCQVTGPNGSGKTTLLRLLAGLSLADDGNVFWKGADIDSVRSDYQSQLLYLGHKLSVSGNLSPRENLSAFLHLRHETPDLSALDSALSELGLGERLDLPCRWLSAGQQRRVALARLALEPAALWILDEPLSALDPNGVDWVVQQIQRQAAQGGSVVFTTHQTLPMDSVSIKTVSLSAETIPT